MLFIFSGSLNSREREGKKTQQTRCKTMNTKQTISISFRSCKDNFSVASLQVFLMTYGVTSFFSIVIQLVNSSEELSSDSKPGCF